MWDAPFCVRRLAFASHKHVAAWILTLLAPPHPPCFRIRGLLHTVSETFPSIVCQFDTDKRSPPSPHSTSTPARSRWLSLVPAAALWCIYLHLEGERRPEIRLQAEHPSPILLGSHPFFGAHRIGLWSHEAAPAACGAMQCALQHAASAAASAASPRLDACWAARPYSKAAKSEQLVQGSRHQQVRTAQLMPGVTPSSSPLQRARRVAAAARPPPAPGRPTPPRGCPTPRRWTWQRRGASWSARWTTCSMSWPTYARGGPRPACWTTSGWSCMERRCGRGGGGWRGCAGTHLWTWLQQRQGGGQAASRCVPSPLAPPSPPHTCHPPPHPHTHPRMHACSLPPTRSSLPPADASEGGGNGVGAGLAAACRHRV